MYLYICVEISKEIDYEELAHALQSLRSPKISVGKLEAWKGRRMDGIVLDSVQRAEDQESKWCKFQSESWQAQDPRRANISVQRQGNTDIPAQGNPAERVLLTSGSLSVLYRPSTDWIRAILMEGNLFHSVY